MDRDLLKKYRYRYMRSIGKGFAGEVSLYRDVHTGGTVAVKKILFQTTDEGIPSSVIREVSLLQELNHPNIIKLLDFFRCENGIYLVFEYGGINLMEYYIRKVVTHPSIVKKYMHQILSGVAYFHARQILHRDLKPQNVLVDQARGVVKIADFGLARGVEVPLEAYTFEIGTVSYLAPEFLSEEGKYSYPADIWSVGCIFAELVTCRRLFESQGLLTRINRTMGTPDEEALPGWNAFCLRHLKAPLKKYDPKDLATVVPGLDKAGLDLLKRMLCMDPRKRITADEALEHEYFRDLKDRS